MLDKMLNYHAPYWQINNCRQKYHYEIISMYQCHGDMFIIIYMFSKTQATSKNIGRNSMAMVIPRVDIYLYMLGDGMKHLGFDKNVNTAM